MKDKIEYISEPLISFIIPVYNREGTLDRCLKSVLDCPGGFYEVILVDDASTDGSAALCAEYARRYGNIKYVRTDVNKGPGNARNMGIDIAKGKYYYFLDSDDEIDAVVLPRLAEVMERDEPDFIYIRHLIVLPDGDVRKKGPKIPEGVTSVELFFERYPDVPSGPAWICIYKAQFLSVCGIRFEQTYYYEDCCFLTSAFINAKNFYMLPELFCTHYAFYTDSLNTKSNIDRELEGFRRYFELCQSLIEKGCAHAQTLEMCKTRLIINIMRNCTNPIFLENFDAMCDISADVPATYEFYLKYGEKSFLAQWLRNLYKRVYDLARESGRQVYLCPVTDFSLAIGTVFADWNGEKVAYLDNNPSDDNYYVRLCKDGGFEVPGVKDIVCDGEKLILLYHKSYAVNREIAAQLTAMSLKEGEDYLSIYSL